MSLYERLGEAESKGVGLNRVDIRELASGREGDVGARRDGARGSRRKSVPRHDTTRDETLIQCATSGSFSHFLGSVLRSVDRVVNGVPPTE